jgi:hypothetical protein
MSWQQIILAWDEQIVKSNPDVELANILDNQWLSLEDTAKEMVELLQDTKVKNTSEDRKLRLEIIKHSQALHWSKASLKNIQVWVFLHPWVWEKLNY